MRHAVPYVPDGFYKNTAVLAARSDLFPFSGDAYREGGFPIFPVTWNDVKSQYCCGKVELSNSKTTCRYRDPFLNLRGNCAPGCRISL
jgi:hypothetical protein